MVASTMIIIDHNATSKVSWQEERGIPFRFVNISGYEGPCSEKDFCREVKIQDFYLWALIFDIVGWYLVSCTISLAYHSIKKKWIEEKSIL
jgi:hypothetical protein